MMPMDDLIYPDRQVLIFTPDGVKRGIVVEADYNFDRARVITQKDRHRGEWFSFGDLQLAYWKEDEA